MIVVVAGSRRAGALPIRNVARTLLVLAAAEIKEGRKLDVRLRIGNDTPPGKLEEGISHLAPVMPYKVEWRKPMTWAHEGRKAVWYRDTDMLEDADLCLCFYTQADVDAGDESGTLSLVDKAMGMDVPVYGYLVDEYKNLTRAGEHDPKDRFSPLLAGILP